MSQQQKALILASGSPRRAEILSEAGIEHVVVPAEVDEDAILAQGGVLTELVEKLALAKATAVAVIEQGKHVLGADTIVVLDGMVLGKPASESQAVQMLNELGGRSHEVVTGVAVVDSDLDSYVGHVSTTVVFRELSDGEIAEYVSSGSPFDKAGGYGIQDHSFNPVASYDDCYLNVVGLPMCATSELLGRSGLLKSGGIFCPGHAGFDTAETGSLR